jgi:uncharacterized protein
MTQSKTGGIQAAKTNKERHGEDYYQRLGAMGGKANPHTSGGFKDKKLAKRAGKIGGATSRRLK